MNECRGTQAFPARRNLKPESKIVSSVFNAILFAEINVLNTFNEGSIV